MAPGNGVCSKSVSRKIALQGFILRVITSTENCTLILYFTLCLFIILLVQFGLLSGHLLGNSCPLGKQFVLIYLFPAFGFKSGICLLIAPVPVHCFSITFTYILTK